MSTFLHKPEGMGRKPKEPYGSVWTQSRKLIGLILVMPALGVAFTIFILALAVVLISNFLVVINGEKRIVE